jgi:hypothetical protein
MPPWFTNTFLAGMPPNATTSSVCSTIVGHEVGFGAGMQRQRAKGQFHRQLVQSGGTCRVVGSACGGLILRDGVRAGLQKTERRQQAQPVSTRIRAGISNQGHKLSGGFRAVCRMIC